MDDEQVQDLKQFISTELSNQTQQIKTELQAEIRGVETRLESKIDTLSDFVAETFTSVNEQNDERFANLEGRVGVLENRAGIV